VCPEWVCVFCAAFDVELTSAAGNYDVASLRLEAEINNQNVVSAYACMIKLIAFGSHKIR
jgi:hypothetical protein